MNDFLASSDFKTKSDRTRGEYERIGLLLQAEHGSKRLAHLKRRHIRQIRDAKAETPGAANNVLRLLKRLLNFAVDDELIESSPAAKMRELPVGEWRAWTDEECARFEARWKPGTMQRRAYAVALYTGQRKRDQISRTRAHRRDGGICVVQSKTDEELWIPEHRELTAELARGVAGIGHLLVTPTQGKPFDETYYGAWFADAIDQAGLPDDCVLHGLRKTAARTLAELGLSETDIQAITGHVTSRMVAKYVKGASQQKRAKRAIEAWENDR
ncbi:MAG TPA: tyrosine-type recombinase/integrase [Hyphomicrobiaceae bacterium]|nr:tyrosine-type recombinase/integrase [Hyphomicrobiaceae bacterium]